MDVRERVLQAATRLMAARGFEGTSVQAVADAVGVTKPSVLYHFPSKVALRHAVLDRLLARWNDVLPRLLMASALTGLAKFDAVTTELFEFFASDPDRARLLARELLDRHGDMNDAIEQYVRPWVKVVSTYVKKGQEAGQIRSDVDPDTYVMQVSSMAIFGLATADGMSPLLGKGNQAMRRTVAELVRMARTSLFVQSYLVHQSQKQGPKRSRGTQR